MAPAARSPPRFPPVTTYDASLRQRRTAAADLDGTLLASSSAFPYYFLVALEAGSPLRAFLLLLTSPLLLFLYTLISEPAAISLLVFLTFAGLDVRDVESVARAVLPRHYAAGVRADTWEVFRGCGGERRVVVTASPAVMVGHFVREFLGAEVAGTELRTCGWFGGGRRFTGLIEEVLVGERKRETVEKLFAGGDLPDVGLGDRESDHDFMAICKEAYMVPTDKRAPRAAPDALLSRAIFHDGRLVRRPDAPQAFFALAYLPVGFGLALLRVFLNLFVPAHLVRYTYRLTGIRLAIRGTPPPTPRPGTPGSLLVCNHRTALDPIIVSVALGRPVTCVTYSVSRVSTWLSPIPAVALSRTDRAADAARIAALLDSGRDVVLCPEGTTCREPFLLRFSALFAELTDRIVPVAVEAAQGTYYGSTASGWKMLDPWFFYMNPQPGYTVTFLPALRPEETCGGGRSAVDVANHVQAVIGKELGYECTSLTRKDKYMKLAGNDGTAAAGAESKENGKKFA